MKGRIMNRISINYLKVSVFVIFAFFALMTYSGPAPAADYSMQTNMNDIADQMARWSEQCRAMKMTPGSQEKLGELLLETSQMLHEMAGKSGSGMNVEHHTKIVEMEKEWDAFDTSSGG
jgi:hypothetical protein